MKQVIEIPLNMYYNQDMKNNRQDITPLLLFNIPDDIVSGTVKDFQFMYRVNSNNKYYVFDKLPDLRWIDNKNIQLETLGYYGLAIQPVTKNVNETVLTGNMFNSSNTFCELYDDNYTDEVISGNLSGIPVFCKVAMNFNQTFFQSSPGNPLSYTTYISGNKSTVISNKFNLMYSNTEGQGFLGDPVSIVQSPVPSYQNKQCPPLSGLADPKYYWEETPSGILSASLIANPDPIIPLENYDRAGMYRTYTGLGYGNYMWMLNKNLIGFLSSSGIDVVFKRNTESNLFEFNYTDVTFGDVYDVDYNGTISGIFNDDDELISGHVIINRSPITETGTVFTQTFDCTLTDNKMLYNYDYYRKNQYTLYGLRQQELREQDLKPNTVELEYFIIQDIVLQ